MRVWSELAGNLRSGDRLGPSPTLTHILDSFSSVLSSWSSSWYYSRSLEGFHFHLNCLNKTDQRNTRFSPEQALSNFSMLSHHLDPFLKSFRASDSSHLGRRSGLRILTSTLAAWRPCPGTMKSHTKKSNFKIIYDSSTQS